MQSRWPSIPARWRVFLAFAAIYFFWGATFLSIRVAIESIPPLYMAGIRFLIAGAILYWWARRHSGRPTAAQWRAAALIGGLLMLGGNGGVSFSEQFIPSGMAALIVATIPIWMVVLEWLHGETRPNVAVLAGLVLGLGGIGLLVEHGQATGDSSATLFGVMVLLPASIAWAAGSFYSRRVDLPASPLLATAMQMLAGGAWLCLAGAITGETGAIRLDRITLESVMALVYLVVFGSLVGFTAYIWLLRVSKPAIVSTYAFVNPVVAVFLGWVFFREPITAQMILAAGIITVGILLIISFRFKARGARQAEVAAENISSRGASSGVGRLNRSDSLSSHARLPRGQQVLQRADQSPGPFPCRAAFYPHLATAVENRAYACELTCVGRPPNRRRPILPWVAAILIARQKCG